MKLLLHLHPAFSALPPTTLIILVILELVGLARSSGWGIGLLRYLPEPRSLRALMLALATTGYALAFGSGYIAADLAARNGLGEPTIVAGHHVLGRLGLISVFSVGAAAWLEGAALSENRLIWQRVYRSLLFVTVLITFIVCFRGGELVFTHGVGVSRDSLNE